MEMEQSDEERPLVGGDSYESSQSLAVAVGRQAASSVATTHPLDESEEEAATEGHKEFDENSLASKRKQFQQACDKFAEAARMVGWGGVQREWGVCLMRWALWESRVLQNKERLVLMKEQDKERERIRSLSFAYGTDGWDPHREADFVTISLGDPTKRDPAVPPVSAAQRPSTSTNSSNSSSNDNMSTSMRSRSKSAGVREEFDRRGGGGGGTPTSSAKAEGFLSSLLRRGNSIIASSLSSFTVATPQQQQASPQSLEKRREDIFEPYAPDAIDGGARPDDVAKQNEDRMISRIHDQLERDQAAGGGGAGETAYREREFTRESEEMQLAYKIESLFEQAYEKFSLGEKLYMEEMNKLDLLKEIELSKPGPEVDNAKGGADDAVEQNQDVSSDEIQDEEKEEKGKEKEEEEMEGPPEAPEAGSVEEIRGGAEENEMDSPGIQEEAAQTYEGSDASNNMEKFYCLLLVEWAECVLNRAKWEHDDLLLESSADLTEQSPADLDAFEEDMRHTFDLYKTACHLFFKAYQHLSRSTDISRDDEKRLIITCVANIDGMLTLKEVQPGVSGDNTAEEGEGGFHEMVDLFLASYSARMMQYGMGEFTLGPLIAIALSKDKHAAEAGKQVLCHLAQDTHEELREQAQIKLDMIKEILKGEEQNIKEAILKELRKLPPTIVADINRNQITQQEIVEHFDIFRNALWFRTRIMLGSPLATTISTSILPFGPSTSFTPAFSARYKRVRLDSCRARRKQRAKRRKESLQSTHKTHSAPPSADLSDVNLVVENPKNRYSNWDVIGQGAFGEVFTAKPIGHPDERVAIKVMRRRNKPGRPTDPEKELRRGKAEIALLARCKHPNIVSLVNSFLWNNTIWVVMEYCDGGTLRQFSQKADIDEPEVAYISKEILKGLQYLHARGQIHRDLKGENVLLNLSGEVKIADLGLAADAKASLSSIAGTPGFIAPEMIKRTGYDTKLDIWSFGCLVMEMVEGSAPYRELLPLKRLMTTAIGGAPTLRDAEKYSKAFRHFLSCCLQPDPKLRYSAAQLLHHPFLEQAIGKERIVTLFSYIFLGDTLEMTGLM